MIETLLSPYGMMILGGFAPKPEDGLHARTVLLVGGVGGDYWEAFVNARDDAATTPPDPLDGWRRRVLTKVARQIGAHAVFPFDGPPYLPFQEWTMRATGLKPGPTGPLIHPKYGPWLALHGALLFDETFAPPRRPAPPHPCDGCADRPCLSACPVGAISSAGYDVQTCRSGMQTCAESGCKARRACPVGTAYAHEPEQAAFHMAAFMKAWG